MSRPRRVSTGYGMAASAYPPPPDGIWGLSYLDLSTGHTYLKATSPHYGTKQPQIPYGHRGCNMTPPAAPVYPSPPWSNQDIMQQRSTCHPRHACADNWSPMPGSAPPYVSSFDNSGGSPTTVHSPWQTTDNRSIYSPFGQPGYSYSPPPSASPSSSSYSRADHGFPRAFEPNGPGSTPAFHPIEVDQYLLRSDANVYSARTGNTHAHTSSPVLLHSALGRAAHSSLQSPVPGRPSSTPAGPQSSGLLSPLPFSPSFQIYSP